MIKNRINFIPAASELQDACNEIADSSGTVLTGTRIRIIRMHAETTPSAAFPDGIDHQAEAMTGKEGEVTWTDDAGQLHGTWGGLALIPGLDEFETIS